LESHLEAAMIFGRTVLIYFFVYVAIRIMGKREIGKLSIFDLVISILIAELAVIVIEDTSMPIWHGLLPMVLLVALQIVLAYLTLKHQQFRIWFDGKPSVIIRNGKLDRKEMHKQRYSLDDLMLQLRENKVNDVADVEFALLEPTGKLTVTTREAFHKNTMDDKQPTVNIRYEGLPIPLIMDGKVQEENLKQIGKTRFWLQSEMRKLNIPHIHKVFLCTLDHRGKLFVDRRE
jgi:uncharacterized membrane protein YcaP (DUF421 family)